MSRKNSKETLYSVLILLPSIILVAIFVYGFIGNTIYSSMTDWKGMSATPVKNFIGLDNYKSLFTSFMNKGFRQDLVNTVFYTVFLLAGTLIVGLLLAILLDRPIKHEGIYRTIFLYPMSLSFIVSGTVWRWLLAPSGGLNAIPTWFGKNQGTFQWISSKKQIWSFNWQNVLQVLSVLVALLFVVFLISAIASQDKKGIKKNIIVIAALLVFAFLIEPLFPAGLSDEEMHGFNLATLGILFAGTWQYSGYAMALYLAGLRGLSGSIKESAKLDGANEFVYYWKIAIPNLKPITMSAVVIMAHISLKMFDLIYAMAGTDNEFTGHPSVRMYTTTFRANKLALGSAMAVILFLFAAMFIIPYMVHSHKERVQ
ncbi:MAG: sugar ABC transporter permease [Sphaerochaetaceae bacterium]|jgi:glucose/mannose transport system permease protein|nr:sugar ABC transporter permease [Sphaerochaetaceae bacterium]